MSTVEASDMPEYSHPNALMERRDGGVYVALAFLPTMDMTGITVVTDNDHLWVTVPQDKALDAFNHPALYLPEAALGRVFA